MLRLFVSESERGWLEWLMQNLFCTVVNMVIVIVVLTRIMVFGEPVTKPLSESSVCYWRSRKQADQDLLKVCVSSQLSVFELFLMSAKTGNFTFSQVFKSENKKVVNI